MSNQTGNLNETTNFSHCEVFKENSACKMFLFVNNFLIMGLLSFIGVLGNIVSILVLCRDSKRNVTSFLLLFLALSDSGLLLVSVFTKQIPIICTYMQTSGACGYVYYVWPYVMRYFFPFTNLFFVMSIWTTCLVTIHRAVAVITPHNAKRYGTVKSVKKQVVILCVLALSITIPRFFEFQIKPNGCMPLYQTNLYSNRMYNIVYKNIVVNLFVNIGPLVILCVLTWHLIKEIRSAIVKRRVMVYQDDNVRMHGCQLTFVLLLVVTVSIICQFPHVVYVLTRVLLPRKSFMCEEPMFYFYHISDTLVVFNSAVNFFLYCFAGGKFRESLVRMCDVRENLYGRSTLAENTYQMNSITPSQPLRINLV